MIAPGLKRVRKVRNVSRNKFGKAHGYSHNSLLKMNRDSAGPRKVLATKIKWARSQFGGKGTRPLKEALGG